MSLISHRQRCLPHSETRAALKPLHDIPLEVIQIKKSVIFLTALVFTFPQNAHSEPPINEPVKSLPGSFNQKVYIGGDCWVVTNYPHISKHVPGTVNVTSTMSCPGKPITIETKLTRTKNGIEFSKKDHKQGVGKLTINVAMPCIWLRGPKITYKAQSWFTNGNGIIYTHSGIAKLQC